MTSIFSRMRLMRMASRLRAQAPRRKPLALVLLFGTALCGVSLAQAPFQTVQWSASVISGATAKRGGIVTVELSAAVLDGWHVYALTQPPGGPTALRVTLDDNPVARTAGAPSGAAPEKKYDPSFDLDTYFYSHSFTLHLPVRLKPHADSGWQQIPLSVRFQTCNGRECQPPTTVHLAAPIEVAPRA